MPNHVHGIIHVGARFIAPGFVSPIQTGVADYDTGAINRAPTGTMDHNPAGAMNHNPAGAMNRAPTVGDIVRAFKAVTTRRIRQHRMANFGWQRNYYEHIIRNEASLDGIRAYIVNNPLQWALDREHPENLKRGKA
jgi:hypothetical protein